MAFVRLTAFFSIKLNQIIKNIPLTNERQVNRCLYGFWPHGICITYNRTFDCYFSSPRTIQIFSVWTMWNMISFLLQKQKNGWITNATWFSLLTNNKSIWRFSLESLCLRQIRQTKTILSTHKNTYTTVQRDRHLFFFSRAYFMFTFSTFRQMRINSMSMINTECIFD